MPSRRAIDRLIGYALAAALAALVAFGAFHLVREARDGGRFVRVRFPEIATLAAGDPVVQNGVTVGAVRRIALEGHEAIATLELFHHGDLPAGTRFLNVSHSLMGARKVWVEPGASPGRLDESRLQDGRFVAGLPETLHKVAALTAEIARLRHAWERALEPGGPLAAATAARQKLEGALARLATLATTLETAAAALDQGAAAAARAERRAQAGLGAGASGLEAARATLDDLRAALAAAESGLAAATGDARAAGAARLLAIDRALYDELVNTVRTLEAVTRALRRDGLGDDIKIRPRFKSGGSGGRDVRGDGPAGESGEPGKP